MHIPNARHQANQQDPWGALRLRRQECSHREIKGAMKNAVASITGTLQEVAVAKPLSYIARENPAQFGLAF
jgi:hypothetical protein